MTAGGSDTKRLERWKGADLLRAELQSGRTHQIRVHLLSIGHAVVGDELYSPAGERGIAFPVPTIVDTGVINLVVAPEVSNLDYNNAIEISGFRIPAIRARKAQTTVELADKESLVIGGLIMETEDNVRVSVPPRPSSV